MNQSSVGRKPTAFGQLLFSLCCKTHSIIYLLPQSVVLKVWSLHQERQSHLETCMRCKLSWASWIGNSWGTARQSVRTLISSQRDSDVLKFANHCPRFLEDQQEWENQFALRSSFQQNPRWHKLTSLDKFLNFSLKLPLQLWVLGHISTTPPRGTSSDNARYPTGGLDLPAPMLWCGHVPKCQGRWGWPYVLRQAW